jgi:cation:H+ antiporter
MLILGGVIGLGLGGHLTILYGSALAESLGISPVIVGLLIVAIGTSLPELVTSIIAALRNEADLCVGNVVGSNLFNSLVVLPLSAIVRPLPIPPMGLADILMSLAFATAIIPVFFLGRHRMDRGMGALFIVAYVGYLAYRVTM